jgi:hypothetical protein
MQQIFTNWNKIIISLLHKDPPVLKARAISIHDQKNWLKAGLEQDCEENHC